MLHRYARPGSAVKYDRKDNANFDPKFDKSEVICKFDLTGRLLKLALSPLT